MLSTTHLSVWSLQHGLNVKIISHDDPVERHQMKTVYTNTKYVLVRMIFLRKIKRITQDEQKHITVQLHTN